MDIERRKYVLIEHRELADPPTWHWALPRAIDMMEARKAATTATGTGKDRTESVDYMVLRHHIMARCLRRLRGQPILRAGEPIAVPETPDIDERVRWVERLPVRYTVEIGAVMDAGGDLDDEDE